MYTIYKCFRCFYVSVYFYFYPFVFIMIDAILPFKLRGNPIVCLPTN